MQLNDCILNALKEMLVKTGHVNDLLLEYYQLGGATSNNLTDAEYEFLIAKDVAPGQVNDMWFQGLTELGFAGALNDMKLEFWCGGGSWESGIPTGNYIYEGGDPKWVRYPMPEVITTLDTCVIEAEFIILSTANTFRGILAWGDNFWGNVQDAFIMVYLNQDSRIEVAMSDSQNQYSMFVFNTAMPTLMWRKFHMDYDSVRGGAQVFIEVEDVGSASYDFSGFRMYTNLQQIIAMSNGFANWADQMQLRNFKFDVNGVNYLDALCNELPAQGDWNGLTSVNNGIGSDGIISSNTIHQLPANIVNLVDCLDAQGWDVMVVGDTIYADGYEIIPIMLKLGKYPPSYPDPLIVDIQNCLFG